MIDSTRNLEPGKLFTTGGKDVWEVDSFCTLPTVTLKNIRTGETTGGGVGCLNLKDFVPLIPEGDLTLDDKKGAI